MKKIAQWGCDVEKAKEVLVIRKQDIVPSLVKKFASLFEASSTTDPEEFFQEHKICIISTKEDIMSLIQEVKKLFDNSH